MPKFIILLGSLLIHSWAFAIECSGGKVWESFELQGYGQCNFSAKTVHHKQVIKGIPTTPAIRSGNGGLMAPELPGIPDRTEEWDEDEILPGKYVESICRTSYEKGKPFTGQSIISCVDKNQSLDSFTPQSNASSNFGSFNYKQGHLESYELRELLKNSSGKWQIMKFKELGKLAKQGTYELARKKNLYYTFFENYDESNRVELHVTDLNGKILVDREIEETFDGKFKVVQAWNSEGKAIYDARNEELVLKSGCRVSTLLNAEGEVSSRFYYFNDELFAQLTASYDHWWYTDAKEMWTIFDVTKPKAIHVISNYLPSYKKETITNIHANASNAKLQKACDDYARLLNRQKTLGK